jgi:hypothetical protein
MRFQFAVDDAVLDEACRRLGSVVARPRSGAHAVGEAHRGSP